MLNHVVGGKANPLGLVLGRSVFAGRPFFVDFYNKDDDTRDGRIRAQDLVG